MHLPWHSWISFSFGDYQKITTTIQGGLSWRNTISLPYPTTDSFKVGNQLYCFMVHLLLCLCFKKLNRYIYAFLFPLLSYRKGHILNCSVLCFYLENYPGKHCFKAQTSSSFLFKLNSSYTVCMFIKLISLRHLIVFSVLWWKIWQIFVIWQMTNIAAMNIYMYMNYLQCTFRIYSQKCDCWLEWWM